MQLPSSMLPAIRAAALVTQMAVAAVLGALVGAALDAWFGTSPLLLLASTGLAFVSGLLIAWRGFSRLSSDNPDDTDGAP